jgi:quinol monooxygenase YgiN
MILITGSVQTKPDSADRLIALCRNHCERSRAEDGCISHNVHADLDDPSRLVFVEYWRDMEALQAHFALRDSRDFVKEARSLSAGGAPMRIFDVKDITPDTGL